MKRIKLIILFIVVFTTNLFSQKVNLDREKIKTQYIKLPEIPIHDSLKKTFSFSSNIPEANEQFTLYGFERIEKNGTIDANLTIGNILIGKVNVNEKKHEDKNDEGKITRVWYTYLVRFEYKTSGTFSFRSPYTTSQPNGVRTFRLGHNSSYSKEFSVYKEATAYAKNNIELVKDKLQRSFIKKEIKSQMKFLNRNYGFQNWSHKELFWILDSKSNPEYTGHKKALEDIKVILSRIKVDTDVKTLEPEVKKLEEYFNSIIPKYPKDKRKHRKMRYASYYNIAKLYYTIDMPQKAKEYANKIIENRYDKSDGKKIIRKANAMLKSFETNKVKTRHFKVETKDSRN